MVPVAALVSCTLVAAMAGEPLPPPPPPSGAAASAPAADPLPPPPPPSAAPAKEATEAGLLPGVRIGPKLAVLPLPGLLGVGLEARIKDTVGLSIDYGFLPELHVPAFSESSSQGSGVSVSNEISDGKVSYRDLGFAVRFMPWHGAFHLGAAYGIRTIQASATGTVSSPGLGSASGVAKIESTSTYLAPELGWRWIWPGGFFMGLDLGWQIIVSQRTTVDVPAYAFPPGKVQDYTDLANKLASTGLPVLSFLQLGWYL
jgi:hypothetical protein